MPKKIIFCADGTWNGPEDPAGASVIDSNDIAGELDESATTNVVKLYANLAGQATPESIRLENEQEKISTEPAQVAKYLHGVGDSRNFILKVLGVSSAPGS